MSNESKGVNNSRRRWPWFLLAALVLGVVLFIVWVWFAVQGVKRIKASTEGLANVREWEAANRPRASLNSSSVSANAA